jgi:hypothetical protein
LYPAFSFNKTCHFTAFLNESRIVSILVFSHSLGRSFSFGDCLYKPRLNDMLRVDTYRSRSLEPWLLTGMVNAYFRPELALPGQPAEGNYAAETDVPVMLPVAPRTAMSGHTSQK